MATQATPSSQAVPANKHTLLTKSLQALAGATGQVNSQSQGIGVASFSPQQVCNKIYLKLNYTSFSTHVHDKFNYNSIMFNLFVIFLKIQQLQQCLAAQKNVVAANSSPNRTQILARNSASTSSDETL